MIAIENVRLFGKVQKARTREVSEALEQADRDRGGAARNFEFPASWSRCSMPLLENATRIAEAKFGVLHGWSRAMDFAPSRSWSAA